MGLGWFTDLFTSTAEKLEKDKKDKEDKLQKEEEKQQNFDIAFEFTASKEGQELLKKTYPTIKQFFSGLNDTFFAPTPESISGSNAVRPFDIISNLLFDKFEFCPKAFNYLSSYQIKNFNIKYDLLGLKFDAIIDILCEQNQLDEKDYKLYFLFLVNSTKFLSNRAQKKLNITDNSYSLKEFFDNDIIDHNSPENISLLADLYLFELKDKQNLITWSDYYLFFKDKIKEKSKEIYKEKLKKQLLNQSELNETKSIDDIDKMNGEEFEIYIGELFKKLGYKIVVTKVSGDQGIDVIVQKGGIKTGIQCKRYTNKVSNSAIQEAVAGKAQYGLDKVMVITTNYFTKSAIELANSNNVVLWNRDKLESVVELTQEV